MKKKSFDPRMLIILVLAMLYAVVWLERNMPPEARKLYEQIQENRSILLNSTYTTANCDTA